MNIIWNVSGQAVLRHAEAASPAVAGVARALWDSFVAIASASLSKELTQAMHLQVRGRFRAKRKQLKRFQ